MVPSKRQRLVKEILHHQIGRETMNTKLAITLLLLSVTAGACVINPGDQEVVETPHLGMELAALKRAYGRGDIDQRQYEARQEILITAWELKVRDQELSRSL